MTRVLIVYNTTKYLVRFRRRFIQMLQWRGIEVHALTPSDEYVHDLTALGVYWHNWPLSRHGTNPFAELRSLRSVYQVIRSVKPSVVFSVTLKPVLYGGIAATLSRVSRRIALIAGLGNMLEGTGLLRSWLRALYRIVLRSYHGILVQNTDDECVIRDLLGNAARKTEVLRVHGSGVDLEEYSPPHVAQFGRPLVMMVSRLVWEKGLSEFCAVANRIGSRAHFVLIGALDTNPRSPTREQIEALAEKCGVELQLNVQCVSRELRRAHIFLYPSYYPEGVPRSIVEALATGLPVITTDVSGCREAIENHVQGILVPPRDIEAIERVLDRLLSDRELAQRMGRAARARAVLLFDEGAIANTMAIFVLGPAG